MAAAAGSKQQLRCVLLYRLLIVAALVIGDVVVAARPCSPPSDLLQTEQLQGLRRLEDSRGWTAVLKEQTTGGRRMLVGSRAPTCTYNECRGCRHRCSVREVPIDASDPINSAYHYKCICHT
ncbi:EPIDERMAL PATTERNING FACTOR-like protein 9 [Phragmites australis]|uniref:EPIDERMAL PATTERNING FACTOR-like protein 9 n=1 Tax=Phragmites australis TaxID=29695 RepID=UPI002D769E23|nr:EPIDERMAL PATTERNING FACTOR-like protein 9 [Phragmites australis]